MDEDEHAEELFQITVKEAAEKHWLEGSLKEAAEKHWLEGLWPLACQ